MRRANPSVDTLPDVPQRTITPGLYLLTGICGIIDAVTFLALGLVFAEIMTGNLMFLAFGIGQGQAVESISAYTVPLITFSLGAIGGGAALRGRWGGENRRFGYLIVLALVTIAFVLTWVWDPAARTTPAMIIVGFLAFAMGVQNALVLTHAVPDVATNVMTLTLVRLLSNWSIIGGNNTRWKYRVASLGVFFVGAMLGAAALRISPAFGLGLAVALYALALPWLLRGRKPVS
jgi:uncharacterized membrane protein YoaK (UPF0700 family)